MAGMSKAGNQYSVGRKQAKSLLTQKPSASVPLGGMNWGNIVTRGGLKMLGVLGGIMSPRKTADNYQQAQHMSDSGHVSNAVKHIFRTGQKGY